MNWKFAKLIGLLLLIFIETVCNGQDTLITKTGAKIPVKIIGINENYILYQIYESDKGVVHTIKPDMISSISYKNGEKQTYPNFKLYNEPAVKTFKITDSLALINVSRFKALTEPGSKVYIDNGEDLGVMKCATFELSSWGYWNIVKDRQTSDFILRFNCKYGFMSGKGFVEFIDPANFESINRTDQFRAIVISFNSKRGFIKKLIKKKIIAKY